MTDDIADLRSAYNLARENGNKLTFGLLREKKEWDTPKIVDTFNKFSELKIGYLKNVDDGNDPLGTESKEVCCIIRKEETAKKLKKLSKVEYVIYCLIEKASNMGITAIDIRKQTKFLTVQIIKATKQLVDVYRLVKHVNHINFKKKKVFMLIDTIPAKEVAGGFFYSNGEFNQELVDNMRNEICLLIQNKQSVTLEDISSFLETSNSGAISDENILCILKTLELELIIQRVVNPINQKTLYMLDFWNHMILDMSKIPCGVCPIFNDCFCGKENQICPQNCEYMSKWLFLDF